MKVKIWKSSVIFLLITFVCIIIGRYTEYAVHELGHYLMALLLGFSLPDLVPVLSPSSLSSYLAPGYIPYFPESFDWTGYIPAKMNGGLVAAGGLLLNGLVALFCFWIFLKSHLLRFKGALTLIFWVLLFNLGALFSYIPLRVFSLDGDVGMFLSSFGIHPFIFLFPSVMLVAAAIILFFIAVLPMYYVSIPVRSHTGRVGIFLISVLMLVLYLIDPIMSGFSILGLIDLKNVDLFSLVAVLQVIFLTIVAGFSYKRVIEKDAHIRFYKKKE